jgi:hypothetical protein
MSTNGLPFPPGDPRNYDRIPPDTLDGLARYVNHAIEPGSFLTAVLENDLREACARADLDNMRSLVALVCFCYNNIPSAAWGSPERVEAWLARRGEDEADSMPTQDSEDRFRKVEPGKAEGEAENERALEAIKTRNREVR